MSYEKIWNFIVRPYRPALNASSYRHSQFMWCVPLSSPSGLPLETLHTAAGYSAEIQGRSSGRGPLRSRWLSANTSSGPQTLCCPASLTCPTYSIHCTLIMLWRKWFKDIKVNLGRDFVKLKVLASYYSQLGLLGLYMTNYTFNNLIYHLSWHAVQSYEHQSHFHYISQPAYF